MGGEPATGRAILAPWLIDGMGGPVRQNVWLHLDRGGIRSIDDHPPANMPASHLSRLANCTLLPGLVDAHVHLTMSGTGDPQIRQSQLTAGYSGAEPVIRAHIAAHRKFGVAAVRDGGDPGGHVLRYGNRGGGRGAAPVQCQSPGRAWRRAGRYGRLIGRPPAGGQGLDQAITMAGDGGGHVKIVNSGLNSLTVFAKETPPQFSLDDMQAAVAAARRLGMDVMVHANGELPVKMAVCAGCGSVEHGFFMGRENLDRMAENRVVWVPTAVTMSAYARRLPPGSTEATMARRNLDHQMEQMRLARDCGVAMAVGTDAGSLGVHHGRAVMEEMALFMAAGWTLPEVVQSATGIGSALIRGRGSGTISPGAPATFIAVAGEPGGLPGSLAQIVARWIDGEEEADGRTTNRRQ
jgi:imidazolonepropionase-like amidohydrolase